MDLLLVNAPHWGVDRGLSRALRFPLGLAYVAQAAREAGASVRVLDANLLLGASRLTSRVVSGAAGSADLVLIGGAFGSVEWLDRLVSWIRAGSQVPIVAGGASYGSIGTVLLRNPEIAAVASGEGEAVAAALARCEGGVLPTVAGLRCRDSAAADVGLADTRFEDGGLWPGRDLFAFDYYRHYGARSDGFSATVQASRGCPVNCAFCGSIFGTRSRARPVSDVVDEIEWLVRAHSIAVVHFVDEVFLGGKKEQIQEFCAQLRARKIEVKWSAAITWHALADVEFLRNLRSAGCIRLSIGIESIEPAVQAAYSKRINTDRLLAYLARLPEDAPSVRLNYLLGFPGEDAATRVRLVSHLALLPIERLREPPQVSWLQLLPGTSFYRDYVDAHPEVDELALVRDLQSGAGPWAPTPRDRRFVDELASGMSTRFVGAVQPQPAIAGRESPLDTVRRSVLGPWRRAARAVGESAVLSSASRAALRAGGVR